MPSPEPKKKLPLVKLAVAAVIVAVLGLLMLRGVDLEVWKGRFIQLGRDAGPFVFFAAMAVVPIVPVPMLAFTLTVGTLFREELGMPLVMALTTLCITINFILTYALARWALRPLIFRIVTRLGYAIPQVPDEDVTDMIVIFRVTPGIPFTVQNYLLGLAELPFWRYVIVSFLAASLPSNAYVIFGEALLHGRGKVIMTSLLVIVALAAGTQLVRKHYAAKRRKLS